MQMKFTKMKIKWFLHQLDCIYSETNENNSISLREFWSTMRQWCHFTIHYDYFILNSKIYYIISRVFFKENTAQKSKFSIKDFFSKCEKIRSFLRIWSHFLKKSLMENFIFCAMKHRKDLNSDSHLRKKLFLFAIKAL